ncbi:MAG: threonylcarbamoyl-AMP synthase [Thaumarchaeota archaeon]|nr:threonylcarbamoyl-AMP synthase [Nitrososphaerota archaeon]|tara:strand:+ start:5881 stop:6498 length:618 start_codon:yes stop_codon:yes gene_type:complete
MIQVKCDNVGISKASQVVKNGGVIVFPTDTVYGLGCDPQNSSATSRVYSIKGRGAKPVPILCAGIEEAHRAVNLGVLGEKLAQAFWPGPLTIVAPLITSFPGLPTSSNMRLGVRVPAFEPTLRLVKMAGGYMLGTSANLSGEISPRSPHEVTPTIRHSIDLLMDCGETSLGRESTVTDVTSEQIAVIREGAITTTELHEALRARG